MKHSLQIIAGAIVVLILFSFSAKEGQLDNAQEVKPKMDKVIPVELLIEGLGIHAFVEPVGILGSAMAVPTEVGNVGWYDLGPRPGDEGSAVLAGHVNWTGGQNAVFTSLHMIKVGDTVKVLDSSGVVNNFVVVRIKDYPVYGDTSEVFSSSDGLQRLNLITCDGLWDINLKTHLSRLVVFTEKI